MPFDLRRWDLSRSIRPSSNGIYRGTSLSYCRDGVSEVDKPNLVSCADLVPVLRLAESAGCMRPQQRVRFSASAGSDAANAGGTVTGAMRLEPDPAGCVLHA